MKKNESINMIKDLIQRSEALAEKLDEINVSQDFLGVFAFSQAHGYTYSGPTYSDELASLKEILKDIKDCELSDL